MSQTEKTMPNEASGKTKRPVLVWLGSVYCAILGVLSIAGLAIAINKFPNHSSEFQLWKYYVLFTPPLVRAVAGIALFFLNRSAVPLSVVMVLFAVTLPISTSMLLGFPSGDIATSYRLLPLITYLDWAILSAVVYYTIVLKKLGKLK